MPLEALRFFKKLAEPNISIEIFEILLNDPYIIDNTAADCLQIDLPKELTENIQKVFHHFTFSNLIFAVKQRKHQQDKLAQFSVLMK